MIWAVVAIVLAMSASLLDSRMGRAIRTLNGARLVGDSVGIDTARLSRSVFVLAALYAGVAGFLFAHFQRFISPTPFNLGASIDYLFMVIIGSAGSLWGAPLGATLVGRSFSGDKKQLNAMLKAAIAHKGTVMLDVVSPCVTFNDHEGSTKSYKYVKEHEEVLQDVSFVPHFEDINVEYDAGSTVDVTMHDGSHLHLRKLEEEYDPTDKIHAITRLNEAHHKGEVLTGIFYVNPTAPSFIEMLNVVDQPLATLPDSMTRPGREVLEAAMEELR